MTSFRTVNKHLDAVGKSAIATFVSLVLALCHQQTTFAAPLDQWILHSFPAHRTDLHAEHYENLSGIRKEIVASRDTVDRQITCLRLIGHAATWKGISKAEYGRRALERGNSAAAELIEQLETEGLVAKAFVPSDDIDDGLSECERVSGIDVTLMVSEMADDQPLVPNLITRGDREARNNRALNRRVEVVAFVEDPPPVETPKNCDCNAVCQTVSVLRQSSSFDRVEIGEERDLRQCIESATATCEAGYARYLFKATCS